MTSVILLDDKWNQSETPVIGVSFFIKSFLMTFVIGRDCVNFLRAVEN
jgi:hypothetical protein